MADDDTRKSLNRALRSAPDAQTRYHIRAALQRLAIPRSGDSDDREVVGQE